MALSIKTEEADRLARARKAHRADHNPGGDCGASRTLGARTGQTRGCSRSPRPHRSILSAHPRRLRYKAGDQGRVGRRLRRPRMIVVDSSAIIAMMLQEPQAAALAARLAVDSELCCRLHPIWR